MQIPDGMDTVDARDVAQGLLLALVQQHHGGSAVLSLAGLEHSMGDAAGRLWAVAIEPIPGDTAHVRVTVVKVGRDETGAH
jgi:nucleoside-diphosphate-sugar epimerase